MQFSRFTLQVLREWRHVKLIDALHYAVTKDMLQLDPSRKRLKVQSISLKRMVRDAQNAEDWCDTGATWAQTGDA